MVIDDNVDPNNLYNDDTPKQYEQFNCAKGLEIEYVAMQCFTLHLNGLQLLEDQWNKMF